MNRNYLWIWLALLAALAPAGCRGKGDRKGEAHEPPSGISFQARHGLLVPPATARFIGLQVAEVAERKVASALQFSAQIYRAAKEAPFAPTPAVAASSALASGTVGGAPAASLREGQTISAAVQGGGALRGRIAGVNRALEKAGGQVEILLALDDPQARLGRGEFVFVTVPLGGEKPVASVPRSALLRTAEGDFVYTVSGERFVRAPVKLGVVNHEFAEVSEGLYEGDRIVVQPVMTLWLTELQSLRGGKACADGH